MLPVASHGGRASSRLADPLAHLPADRMPQNHALIHITHNVGRCRRTIAIANEVDAVAVAVGRHQRVHHYSSMLPYATRPIVSWTSAMYDNTAPFHSRHVTLQDKRDVPTS